MDKCILSIDQGTTSSRAMLFDSNGQTLFTAQQEFTQYFPADGWVEHDPEEIWASTLGVVRDALREAAGTNREVAAIGITNQRETTLIWDKRTGMPIHNAIVWQDRRTASYCEELKSVGAEPEITEKTGLLLDPYFSATKARWILDSVDGARQRAAAGELVFGTVDTFLIWRLTGGRVHATDATNASRTLLFNIAEQCWDADLLERFDVPATILPDVRDCADDFGTTDADVVGQAIPIAAVAGDQHAALIGQTCFKPGMIKSTYGTGCFLMLNTGTDMVRSQNRLLTTVGYRLKGETTYAIEGSIFVAGSAVQWLRDGIGVIDDADETEALAASLDSNHDVYLVPAFTGLGAPHWDPDARGAVFGITRDTNVAQLVRATLESVCYQTYDLIEATRRDGISPQALRVDGGMVRNNWVCQFLSDVLDLTVEKPIETETTALGVAYLAGLQVGIFQSLDEISAGWRTARAFNSGMADWRRAELLRGWEAAVDKVKTQP